jgi:hypothetical protein
VAQHLRRHALNRIGHTVLETDLAAQLFHAYLNRGAKKRAVRADYTRRAEPDAVPAVPRDLLRAAQPATVGARW